MVNIYVSAQLHLGLKNILPVSVVFSVEYWPNGKLLIW